MKGFAAVTPLERFSVLFCPHFSAAAINLSHLCVLGLLLIFSFHSDYEKLKNIAKKKFFPNFIFFNPILDSLFVSK